MKVATLVRCYGLTRYLRPILKQYDWVDKILIVNSKFKGVQPREDKTREIAEGLNQKNISIVSNVEPDLHQALNFGVEQLSDYDVIFISDADEIISRKDQQRIVDEIGNSDAVTCKIIDYARSLDQIFPIRGHTPIVAVKPTTRFNDVRCSYSKHKFLSDVYVHHFGYVYPEEEMSWKINWEKPWEHNTVIDLLSKLPSGYQMPEEIRELLNA